MSDGPTTSVRTTVGLQGGQVVLPPGILAFDAGLRRPRDGLVLDLTFAGFVRSKQAGISYIGPASGGGRIVVAFPPQGIAETTVPSSVQGKWPPVAAVIAGGSVLVFDVPAATAPFPFTAHGVLAACANFRLVLAYGTDGGVVATPGQTATGIEVPWRLVLSPGPTAAFAQTGAIAEAAGRVALWHTRLGAGDAARKPTPEMPAVADARLAVSVRAIAALDPDNATSDTPMRDAGTLTARDRKELATLTAGRALLVGDPYQPSPASARRLLLTPLGATLDLHGAWPERPAGITLEDWRHRAAVGRDSHVKTTRAGFLAPFGHRASLVTVSERVALDLDDGSGPVAPLLKREFIMVRDPVRAFPEDKMANWRTFPLADVELLTLITPDQGAAVPPFVPRTGPKQAGLPDPPPLLFELLAHDRSGREIRFRMPLVFCEDGQFTDLVQLYNDDPPVSGAFLPESGRMPVLGGQLIRLAAPPLGGPDSVSLPVDAMEFALTTPGLAGDRFPFSPTVASLRAELPGVQEFAGRRVASELTYAAPYTQSAQGDGFGASNRGEVVLAVSGVPESLFATGAGKPHSDTTEAAGGLMTPTIAIHGLSRKLGAVTGRQAADPGLLGQVAAGTLDPLALMGDVLLLGSIPLGSLLKQVTLGTDPVDSLAEKALRMRRIETPEAIEVHFDLLREAGDVQEVAVGPLAFRPGPAFELKLDSTVRLPKDGSPPQTRSYAHVRDAAATFSLGPMGGVGLGIAVLSLELVPGAKPDFVLAFSDPPIAFTGAIGFVQKLMSVVPPGAFSDPPDLAVDDSGVRAGYSLGLPPIQLGALALSNIGFAAAFTLPFIGGRPALRVGFASRERPFGILVALLGGGGFFAIEVDTGGGRPQPGPSRGTGRG